MTAEKKKNGQIEKGRKSERKPKGVGKRGVHVIEFTEFLLVPADIGVGISVSGYRCAEGTWGSRGHEEGLLGTAERSDIIGAHWPRYEGWLAVY